MPGAAAGIDPEGGGALLVEGAAGGPTAPGLLESRDPLADHVLDGGSKLDGLDGSAERFVVHGGDRRGERSGGPVGTAVGGTRSPPT